MTHDPTNQERLGGGSFETFTPVQFSGVTALCVSCYVRVPRIRCWIGSGLRLLPFRAQESVSRPSRPGVRQIRRRRCHTPSTPRRLPVAAVFRHSTGARRRLFDRVYLCISLRFFLSTNTQHRPHKRHNSHTQRPVSNKAEI
eukprot:5855643-Prymnesium_polylepis.1